MDSTKLIKLYYYLTWSRHTSSKPLFIYVKHDMYFTC